MALRPYHTLALCAGAGGLELGVELAVPHARCVAYVEREAYAAGTLVARMEAGELVPAPVWSDLATFDARPWRGRVHCITSGDPCQDNSCAGLGLGAAGERFLAPEVVRIARECRPDRVFRENVTGNAHGQLAAIVPALESLGYCVAAIIVSVSGVGGAHGRDRLFIMADRPGVWRQQDERCKPDRAGERLSDALAHAAGRGCPSWAENAARCGVGLQGPGRATLVADGGGQLVPILCPGPADQRWPDIIARAPHLEPAVRRMADGVAHRVDRLRICGNGVHPLAAGYAWLALDALLAEAETGATAVAA